MTFITKCTEEFRFLTIPRHFFSRQQFGTDFVLPLGVHIPSVPFSTAKKIDGTGSPLSRRKKYMFPEMVYVVGLVLCGAGYLMLAIAHLIKLFGWSQPKCCLSLIVAADGDRPRLLCPLSSSPLLEDQPSEECQKTCGQGVKWTKILSMGYSTILY